MKKFIDWFLMRDKPVDEFERYRRQYEYNPFYIRLSGRLALLLFTLAIIFALAKAALQKLEHWLWSLL